MKKSEAQEALLTYHQVVGRAQALIASGAIQEGYVTATQAIEHIPGMVHHETKIAGESLQSVAAIEIICEYAPFFFDTTVLDHLETLFKKKRAIDRDTDTSLPQLTASARHRCKEVHWVWNTIERYGPLSEMELRNKLPSTITELSHLLKRLVAIGVVQSIQRGTEPQFQLTTDMQRPRSALCPHCGARVRAGTLALLDTATCPKCTEKVQFLLVDG